MSDKSVWDGLSNLIGRKNSGSRRATTAEQRCPECQNALDPRWTKCPYCEAARNANNQSSRAASDAAAAGPSLDASHAQAPTRASTQAQSRGPTRGATRTDIGVEMSAGYEGARAMASGAAPGGVTRGRTIAEPISGGALGVERHVGGGRRLTGIVTTFTWTPLGRLYPVYDGRNFAGSDVVTSNNNAPCDIHVPEDRTMSSSHFLILYQSGKYIISDQLSTNGTFVNGEHIDTRGVELPDDAVIKAGATVFKFQKIVPPSASVQSPPREESGGWKPGQDVDPVA